MYGIAIVKDKSGDNFREGIIRLTGIRTVHDVTHWPRWNRLPDRWKPVLKVEYADEDEVFINSELAAFLSRINIEKGGEPDA